MSLLNALTFKQLRALTMVCETGSIKGAAEMLSLTPPAVHNQLKMLTNTIGAEVVTRTTTGAFAPTAEGSVLLAAFEKSEAAMSRALYEIEALRRGVAGQVVLGVVSTGKYFAPGIVARLKRSHPEIEVRLEIGNRNQIIAGLESESIDVAIMGRPPRRPEVTAYPIGDHPHLLIASPENPLGTKAAVSHDDILDQTMILREEGSGTRILAMRFLDRIGEGRPFRQIEMDSNETIKQAVIADLGVALISAHTVIDELAAGRLVHIRAESLPIYRQWFVLHRDGLRLSGAMHTVIDAIRTESAAILRSEEVARLIGAGT
ncbi:MAG TPA: LysR family transcriptional regulator [Paracoccaceae bacterium]|nr:LysR family transcriptional regulator [Paracoccaceae bacterium]